MAIGDATRRGRLVFWVFVASIALLGGIPSLLIVDTARDYARFISGWEPGTLRRSSPRSLPHRGSDADAPIHFVEFRLVSSRAKSVRVSGSFNHWSTEGLGMRRGRAGEWRALVPLPQGAHLYAFLVDGVWTPDPRGAEKAVVGGREVSVRRVP